MNLETILKFLRGLRMVEPIHVSGLARFMNYNRGNLQRRILPKLLALRLVETYKDKIGVERRNPWAKERKISFRPVIMVRLTKRSRQFLEMFDGD